MNDKQTTLKIEKESGETRPVICQLPRAAVHRLAEIDLECNRPPWTPRMFNDEFSNSQSFLWGARLGGELNAFLVCHVFAEEAHIVNFGVSFTARRRGVGRTLIASVLRDLNANAVRWVTLEVRKGNRIARALYESLGFSEVGVREKYYSDDGEDALVMSLNVVDFISRYGDDPSHVSNFEPKNRAANLG